MGSVYSSLSVAVFALSSRSPSILAVCGLYNSVDNSVEAFAPQNSEEIKTLHEYRDTFGRADAFVLLVEGDVFTLPFLKQLDALHRDIAAIDVKVGPPLESRARTDAPKSLDSVLKMTKMKTGVMKRAAPLWNRSSLSSICDKLVGGQTGFASKN